MMERDAIEKILRINGLSASSPDEEIRAVLSSARFTAQDADAAIVLLRQAPDQFPAPASSSAVALKKVFQTDGTLNPKEISELLGIEVDITDHIIERRREALRASRINYPVMLTASCIIAASGLLLYMYTFKIGPFHPAVKLSFFHQ